jgi:tetratricopeptide (TPR) repeat protein
MAMQANRWTFVLVGLALCVAAVLEAQRGALRGEVLDEENQPLEGVQVLVEKTTSDGRPLRPPRRYNAKSNDKGEFNLVALPTGRYRATFTKKGFEKLQLDTNVIDGIASLDQVRMLRMLEGALDEEDAKIANEYLSKANDAAKAGDYRSAIENMKKFLEFVPGNAEAHFNLAAHYENAGEPDNALASYQKVVELRPTFYEAWVAIAGIYGSRQGYQEAVEAFGKAVEIRPDDPLVLFNYAAYATNAGDTETAQKAFEMLTELDPNHALAHYQLAMIKISQQKNEEAIAHLEKYLELEPEGANADTAKALLEQLKQS